MGKWPYRCRSPCCLDVVRLNTHRHVHKVINKHIFSHLCGHSLSIGSQSCGKEGVWLGSLILVDSMVLLIFLTRHLQSAMRKFAAERE